MTSGHLVLLTSGEYGPVLQKGHDQSICLTFKVSPQKQANKPKPWRLPTRGKAPALFGEGERGWGGWGQLGLSLVSALENKEKKMSGLNQKLWLRWESEARHWGAGALHSRRESFPMSNFTPGLLGVERGAAQYVIRPPTLRWPS